MDDLRAFYRAIQLDARRERRRCRTRTILSALFVAVCAWMYVALSR